MASAVYRLRTALTPAQTSAPAPPAGPDKNCGAHPFCTIPPHLHTAQLISHSCILSLQAAARSCLPACLLCPLAPPALTHQSRTHPPPPPGRRAPTCLPRSARAWARACSPTTCPHPTWTRRWARPRSWRHPASCPSWCRCGGLLAGWIHCASAAAGGLTRRISRHRMHCREPSQPPPPRPPHPTTPPRPSTWRSWAWRRRLTR